MQTLRARGRAAPAKNEEPPIAPTRRPLVLQPLEATGDPPPTDDEESRSRSHLLATTQGRAVHLQSDLIAAAWSSQTLSEAHGLEPHYPSAKRSHASGPGAARQQQLAELQYKPQQQQQQQQQQVPQQAPAVRSEVLLMLIKVAEELNQAQAEFEYRKQLINSSGTEGLKASYASLAPLEEEATEEMRQGLLPPRLRRMLSHDLAAMRQVYEDKEARGSRPPSRVMPAALPAVLAKTREEQRWGHFACGSPKLWVPPPPPIRTAHGPGAQDSQDAQVSQFNSTQAGWQRRLPQRRRSTLDSEAAVSPSPPDDDEMPALEAALEEDVEQEEEQEQEQGQAQDEQQGGGGVDTAVDQEAAARTIQHHWRQHRARRAALLADQGVREPLSDEDEDPASDTGSQGHGDNEDQGAGSENASQHSGSPRGSSDGSAVDGGEGAGQRVAKAKRRKAPGKGAKGKQPQSAGAAGAKSKSSKKGQAKTGATTPGRAGSKPALKKAQKGSAAPVHVVDVVEEAVQRREQVVRGGTFAMQRSARPSDAGATPRPGSDAGTSPPSPLTTDQGEGRLPTDYTGLQSVLGSGGEEGAGGSTRAEAGEGLGDTLEGDGSAAASSGEEEPFEGPEGVVDFPVAPARPSSPGHERNAGSLSAQSGSRGSARTSSPAPLSAEQGQRRDAEAGLQGALSGGASGPASGEGDEKQAAAEAVVQEAGRAFPLGHGRLSALLAAAAVLEQQGGSGAGQEGSVTLGVTPLEEGDPALMDNLPTPGAGGQAAGAATPSGGDGAAAGSGELGAGSSPGPFEVMYALSRLSVPPPTSPRRGAKTAMQGGDAWALDMSARRRDASDAFPLELVTPTARSQPQPHPRPSHLTEILQGWTAMRQQAKPDAGADFTLTGTGSEGLPAPRAPSTARQTATQSPRRQRMSKGTTASRPQPKPSALQRPIPPPCLDKFELVASGRRGGAAAAGGRHGGLGLLQPRADESVGSQQEGSEAGTGTGSLEGTEGSAQDCAAAESSAAEPQVPVTAEEKREGTQGGGAGPAVQEDESWHLTQVPTPACPSSSGAASGTDTAATLPPLTPTAPEQSALGATGGQEGVLLGLDPEAAGGQEYKLRLELVEDVAAEPTSSSGTPTLPAVVSGIGFAHNAQRTADLSSSVERLPCLSSSRASAPGASASDVGADGAAALLLQAGPGTAAALAARSVADRVAMKARRRLQVDVNALASRTAASGATAGLSRSWSGSAPLPHLDTSPIRSHAPSGPPREPLSPLSRSHPSFPALGGTTPSPGRWGCPLTSRAKTTRMPRQAGDAADSQRLQLPPGKRSLPTSPGPTSPSHWRASTARVTLPRLPSPQRQRMQPAATAATCGPSDLDLPRHVMDSVEVWAERCLQMTMTRSSPAPEESLSWAVHTLMRSSKQDAASEAAEEGCEDEEPISPTRY